MWPDTVLVMTDHTGIEDVETQCIASLHLSQSTPNPFDGTTFVNLNVTELGEVSLTITDITGRIVGANNYSPLQTGDHEIRVTLSSAGIYFFTARQNGQTASVKMVNGGNGGGNAIAITGTVGANDYSPLPHYYINSELDSDIYGYLYNWPAAILACPEGWHLPNDTEWTQLTDYLSSQSYYVCGGESEYIAKVLASETGWNSYNGGMGLGPSECCPGDQSVNVNNVSGFGAFPMGFVGDGAEWVYVRVFTFFWSSTQNGADEAWFRGLSYYNASMNRNYSDKASGYSVRCLRD